MTKPVQFKVAVIAPARHIVAVEMTVRGLEDDAYLDVALPVWTPGSYLIREYSQFVTVHRAVGQDGERRGVVKRDKATWRIDVGSAREVTLRYEVYAHELNVRYGHVEADHAFLHWPALLMYPVDRLGDEIDLVLELPEGWKASTGLRKLEGAADVFEASDFDELYDCPVLAGDLRVQSFEALDVPHRFVFWGRGNFDAAHLAVDTAKIVEASAGVFGGALPYQSFSFLTLLTDDQHGGLEHRNSTALMYPRLAFVDRTSDEEPDAKYLDFLSLVAHEHFHAWNVKRIRPERLGPFDYQRENYTRDLWTVEGITSYYQNVSLLRAGHFTPSRFLQKFADHVGRLNTIPGRHVRSLEDASFDAWIRLYRPHPHNRNSNISYYLKGALAAFVLDVMIRVDTEGARSLDDVMRNLWTHYSGEQGYPEGGFEAIVEEIVGNEVGEFFDVFVRGTEDPDWNDWLENIGIALDSETEPGAPPFVGFDVDANNKVRSVEADSPADGVIDPGDEIVAIDGYRAAGRFEDLVREATPGETLGMHIFRRGELLDVTLEPEEPRPTKWSFRVRDDADASAIELLEGWLGTTELEEPT